MKITIEYVQGLLEDPDAWETANTTDHAEWFGGGKPTRCFGPTDILGVGTPHVFEAENGLFLLSPRGRVVRVNLDAELWIAGRPLRVEIVDGGLGAVG